MPLQIRERLDAAAIIEPIPPRRTWDWVLTGLLASAAVMVVVFDDSLPLWAGILPAVIATAFVPFRRDIPLVAVITTAVVAAAAVALALRGTEVDDVGSPAGLTDIVLFYALCRWSTPIRVVIGFAVSIASEIVIGWASGGVNAGDWPLLLPWLLIVAFALAMRYRARAIEGRYEQVRLEERNTLARELHDTVAHHMSAVAVQAQAGQYVVDADPRAAAD
ncbi:MAG: histidine kinase dimerization/phosphoacceptor domain-containing protein, partial [Actinomycetota bacterium]